MSGDSFEGFSDTTRALHTRVDINNSLPSVTPLFQNSAFQTGSPYFYTRKNNPNCEELERMIAILENSRFALSVTTGMSALSSVLTLLSPEDTIVVNKDTYGCSYKFFFRVAERLKGRVVVLDLSLDREIDKIPEGTRLVILETPTNPFLKTITISKVSQVLKKRSKRGLLVVDNTWATPLFQKPLNFGADISLHSATKYFGGHSDVMGGLIATNDETLDDHLRQERFFAGHILDPHSAWLIVRSMQTFALRMREHEKVTLEMKAFLEKLPQVKKVYYPEIDGKQMTGYGSIVFFELREDLAHLYSQFSRALKLFTTGTGMAAVTSMVAQPFTGSHASMTPAEKEAMGLKESLVRLCFGFENPDDLKKDLIQAFRVIESITQR